jgi:hypothetical protein
MGSGETCRALTPCDDNSPGTPTIHTDTVGGVRHVGVELFISHSLGRFYQAAPRLLVGIAYPALGIRMREYACMWEYLSARVELHILQDGCKLCPSFVSLQMLWTYFTIDRTTALDHR